MWQLNRWLNSFTDRDFRNRTNDNWTVIEKALSSIESLSEKNKKDLLARIDNLIINSGNSSPEVADARLDADGTRHAILKGRLDSDQQKNNALIQAVTQEVKGVSASISNMSDPLSYLNSVKILCRIPTKQVIGGKTLWLQGLNINEDTGEIYTNYQDETLARIEIFDLNGQSKGSKQFTIAVNAYMETLPYFYIGNDLNFIVRTTANSNYNIYNWTKGTMGGQYSLSGRRTIAARDGDRLLTVEENVSTGSIMGLNIYEWDSVKIGNPKLLGQKTLETTANTPEKTQGVVQNKGYTFLMQGAWKGQPYLTVLNNAGKIVNVFRYSKRSLANIMNKYYPNAIPSDQLNTWEYEAEGGCVYKGKLVTTQVAPDWAYLFIHNMADGTPIEVEPDATQAFNGDGGIPTAFWFNRNSFSYSNGTNSVVKHDKDPRWTQGKVPVTYDGTYYKTTEDGMYDIDVFLSLLCKGAAAEHTIAVDFMRDSDNSVVLTLELDSFANGFENRYARLYGKVTWFFEKDTRFKIMYKNNDGLPSEHYETRVTIKKM